MISKVNMLLLLGEYIAEEIMNYVQDLPTHIGNSRVHNRVHV